MDNILKSKTLWIFMVVLAALLMIIGFFTRDLTMWGIAFIISIMIRLYAYDLLFGNYKNRLESLRGRHGSVKG
ncbi:hypothetical protein [Corticicoccus populi]|uniref:Uncharacterized protein n=1 Tax=Corticicoccus populi TaxID=1812821 RepID=A0ABW5WX19_9STAP